MDAQTPKAEVPADQRPARPGLIVLLMVMSAIGPVSLNILVPATPGLAVLFDTKVETVQLTLSLYLFGLAVSQLVLGPLSDRFGRKPVLLAGLFITAAASTAAMFSTSIGMLILFRSLQALGASSGLVIGRAIIRDLYTRDRAAAMIGLVTTVMVLAPMAAPLIGGILDTHFGWEYTFALTGAMAALVLAWVFLALPETRPDHITGGGVRYIVSESRELLSDRRFLGYMLVAAIGTATFFAFLGGGPHVVVSIMARTSAEFGVWFIATSVGFMLGNFITSRSSQRYGVDRLIAIGLVLLVIGSVATVATVAAFPDGGPWTVFVPQLAISLGNGIFLPNCVAGAVSVRPKAAGTASGITGFVQMATGAVAAQAMSHIVATASTAMPLAVAMVVLSGAAALAFYVFLSRARR
ncbi:multidrug effflux MFS transporter [Pseudorhodoplanes sp.]|uniref:multidrug effflux MFS transporter n=1 Tax=Pseudorhodoplanes sp. TaxID=1934341 RepID=UPI002C30AD97|nr:multidrug effflux MFS transporter [Pseudorhodoplanes sp.]HWV40395.1 multidrug effflux MFS transporter [Pseudorhodoplanes sp.]